jgi:hypothetical protein
LADRQGTPYNARLVSERERRREKPAMMHVEFVVLGPPISNQSPGPNLDAWRAAVRAEAQSKWVNAPLVGNLKAMIINFHSGDKASVDVDNMSKPILDVLNGLVYLDDRRITQAEISHVRIRAPMSFAGASKILVDAVQADRQCVYVRVEDPVDPFPLPR